MEDARGEVPYAEEVASAQVVLVVQRWKARCLSSFSLASDAESSKQV